MDKPRAAQTTIKEVDGIATPIEICAEVRSFEAFKHLHVGMSPNQAEDATRNFAHS